MYGAPIDMNYYDLLQFLKIIIKPSLEHGYIKLIHPTWIWFGENIHVS